MNDAERNKTVSWIVTITIGVLVALLIGIVLGFVVAKPQIRKVFGLDETKALGVQKSAFVSFTPPGEGTDVTCTQYTGGLPGTGGILYARPNLSKNDGDTIQWHGPIGADVVTATFATSGLYGPFANPSYTSGNFSSAPTGGQGDYSFSKLTITRGNTTYNCTNYQGMGVHVDQ